MYFTGYDVHGEVFFQHFQRYEVTGVLHKDRCGLIKHYSGDEVETLGGTRRHHQIFTEITFNNEYVKRKTQSEFPLNGCPCNRSY